LEGELPALPALTADSLGPSKEGFMPSTVSGGGCKVQRHARGNWPSHVFLPLPPSARLVNLAVAAVNDARRHMPAGVEIKPCFPWPAVGSQGPQGVAEGARNSVASEASTPDWAHVSLSKPFFLRRHELDPFEVALRDAVADTSPFTIVLAPHGWTLLGSDDKDRAFLVLGIEEGAEELEELVERVDQALARFGRPPYYEEPHFHVTVAEVAAPFSGDLAQIATVKSRAARESSSGESTGTTSKEPKEDNDRRCGERPLEVDLTILTAKMGHYKRDVRLFSFENGSGPLLKL